MKVISDFAAESKKKRKILQELIVPNSLSVQSIRPIIERLSAPEVRCIS